MVQYRISKSAGSLKFDKFVILQKELKYNFLTFRPILKLKAEQLVYIFLKIDISHPTRCCLFV